MPQTHRIDFVGARDHVMNRGARRAPVFSNDEARGLFVEVLAELPEQFGVRIHGYAVMPNHFHLLLETPRANLSESMRRLFGGARAIAAYVDEHRTGRGTAPDGWDAQALWKPSRSMVTLSRAPQPTASVLSLSARSAIAEVARATGCTEERLLKAARGRRNNRPRWVAAWWLSRRAGLTHRQVSRLLGCQPSGVSHMLARLRARSDDDELATWLATLEERARAARGGPEEGEV
jgi:REP element-mobilizing transposase RayT